MHVPRCVRPTHRVVCVMHTQPRGVVSPSAHVGQTPPSDASVKCAIVGRYRTAGPRPRDLAVISPSVQLMSPSGAQVVKEGQRFLLACSRPTADRCTQVKAQGTRVCAARRR
eukprot:1404372-Prymnesium_polylepis.1